MIDNTGAINDAQEKVEITLERFGLVQQELAALMSEARDAILNEARLSGDGTWTHEGWLRAARTVESCSVDIAHECSTIHQKLVVVRHVLAGKRVWPEYTPSGVAQ